MGSPSQFGALDYSAPPVISGVLPPISEPDLHRAVQRTHTLLTVHQNRWRWEMAELLERINQVALPLDVSGHSYDAILQRALAQLDDDQFAQWVAAVWDEGDRSLQAGKSKDLEDWGVATLVES